MSMEAKSDELNEQDGKKSESHLNRKINVLFPFFYSPDECLSFMLNSRYIYTIESVAMQ